MRDWDAVDWIFASFFVFLFILLSYTTAVSVASEINKKACLEAGYPKQSTTWDFEGYCMNLEGTVTVGVEKL
jgi:hypothetical protein